MDNQNFTISFTDPPKLIGPNGDSIELTHDELKLLSNYSTEEFQKTINLRFNLNDESKKSCFEIEFEKIRRDLPSDSLLVLLDTSTVANAFDCLNGRVTPLNLLDLSVVTYAAICFDKIIIQPNPKLALGKIDNYSDIFFEIRYPEDFVKQQLWGLLDTSFIDVKEIEDKWCNFLHLAPNEIDLSLYAYDEYQDSPMAWNGIVASHYSEFLNGLELKRDGDKKIRNEFLSIQTMRALFNDRLANMLGIPYLSSSFKSSIHSLILKYKVETRHILDRIIYSISSSENIENDHSYCSQYSAPFLLGLILEQMKEPYDYWEKLYYYRQKFSPLRKKILQDRDNWSGKPTEYLAQYLKFIDEINSGISPEFDRSKNRINAGAAIGSTICTVSPVELKLVGVGIKLLQVMIPTKQIHNFYLKHRKPAVYLFVEMAEEARHLRMVENHISRIWGKTWSREFHEQLKEFSDTSHHQFQKLRRV